MRGAGESRWPWRDSGREDLGVGPLIGGRLFVCGHFSGGFGWGKRRADERQKGYLFDRAHLRLLRALGGSHARAHERKLVAEVAAVAAVAAVAGLVVGGGGGGWWRAELVRGRSCWQGGNGGKLTVTVATLAIGGKEAGVVAFAGELQVSF